MSRHEGVSCDVCNQHNFTGLRYKCLRCYDFDLCSNCYNLGVTSLQHSIDHPMQCILTRSDANIIYGGSPTTTCDAYSCPYCGSLGFSAVELLDHVQGEHSDRLYPDVICSICATQQDMNSNARVDNLEDHLLVAHPSLTAESPSSSSSSTAANTTTAAAAASSAAADSAKLRYFRLHNNNQLQTTRATTNSQSVISRSNAGQSGGDTPRNLTRSSLLHLIDPGMTLSSGGVRDVMDPITELLSHLNSVRGRLAGTAQGVANHLQQLEVQLTTGGSKNQSSLSSSIDRQHHHIRSLYTELELASGKRNDGAAVAATSGGGGGGGGGRREANQYLLSSNSGANPLLPSAPSSSHTLHSSSSSPSLSSPSSSSSAIAPSSSSSSSLVQMMVKNDSSRQHFVQELSLFCTSVDVNLVKDDNNEDDKHSSSSPSFTQLPLSLSSSSSSSSSASSSTSSSALSSPKSLVRPVPQPPQPPPLSSVKCDKTSNDVGGCCSNESQIKKS